MTSWTHSLVFFLQLSGEGVEAKTFAAKVCGTDCGVLVLSIHLYGNSLSSLFSSSSVKCFPLIKTFDTVLTLKVQFIVFSYTTDSTLAGKTLSIKTTDGGQSVVLQGKSVLFCFLPVY